MFASIIDLVNIPFGIRPYLSQSGTGTKNYAPTVNKLCYPQAQVVVIKNNFGKEVTSATQLHIDGSINISDLDIIVFEGREWSIEKISTFYRDGIPDIRVVYL